MAIVFNSDAGTISGLSVGGLPDGIVDSDTLASGAGGVSGVTSSADATAITIDSSEQVGIANTSPNSYDAEAKNLVVGSGTGHQGMTIVAGTSSKSKIHFADGTGAAAYKGMVHYDHNADTLNLATSGNDRLSITSDGRAISQFTARGWVHFSGVGTLSIADSHNVSSVTDSSNGHYEINWSNNMANTNYSVACTSGHKETESQTDSYTITSFRHQGILTNKVEIQCIRARFDVQQMADPYIVCLTAFGD